MRRSLSSLALLLVMTACSPTADFAADELANLIAADSVAFDTGTVPQDLIDRAAEHSVVLLGETHHLQEHWEFVSLLLAELHSRGVRQLLVERPQMQEWLVNEYVTGGPLADDWTPPPFFDRRFTAIRELNLGFDPSQRIVVRGIDVNVDSSGGAAEFRVLLEFLTDSLGHSGPVEQFIASPYETPDEQRSSLEALATSLEQNRDELEAVWGADRYAQVVRMVEVEAMSIEVRALDGEDESRAREDGIKDLVEEAIGASESGTIINIGAHHAQKSPLMGTDQEWVGDYLAHRSPAAAGDVLVIGFTSAVTELLPGAGGTPWDVIASSPENEIYRIMAETWPGQSVYLPLDDPVFGERTVAMNSEEVIYVTRLSEQFDALVQYGLAHRWPVD